MIVASAADEIASPHDGRATKIVINILVRVRRWEGRADEDRAAGRDIGEQEVLDAIAFASVYCSSILQEWDFARQQTALSQKLVQLDALRLRAPTNFVGVVAGYRRQLSDYVARRQRIARSADAPMVKSLVKETLQKLGELDVRREIAVGGASGTAALKPE